MKRTDKYESIKLNRSDGEVVDIDMSPIVGWYIGE